LRVVRADALDGRSTTPAVRQADAVLSGNRGGGPGHRQQIPSDQRNEIIDIYSPTCGCAGVAVGALSVGALTVARDRLRMSKPR
jgi:hypothetical protein